jgi:hypothetical protein
MSQNRAPNVPSITQNEIDESKKKLRKIDSPIKKELKLEKEKEVENDSHL